MNDIIGKLIYPESAFDAEIYQSSLYLTDNGNQLVFNIINRSSVAVTAFHADVIYFDNEEQKKISVEKRDCYIEPNGVSGDFTVLLPKGIEEGRIALPVVLYDNLTASQSYINVPFASFDVVSKFAVNYLSGAVSPAVQYKAKPQTTVSVEPIAKPINANVEKVNNAKPVVEEKIKQPLTDEQRKKKTTKQVLSLVFMGVALIFMFIAPLWLANLSRGEDNVWGERYIAQGKILFFYFAMLVAIACAFVSSLERKGFDKGRWAITLANSFSGSVCWATSVVCLIMYGSWITLFLTFVYPIVIAVIARFINKEAVPTVLLIMAFALSWLSYGSVLGRGLEMAIPIMSMLEVAMMLVAGLLTKCKKGKRLTSSKVFAILTTVIFCISLVMIFIGGFLSITGRNFGDFMEVFAFCLFFLIPFIVGFIVALVRKDRFAWILLLCLIVITLLLPLVMLIAPNARLTAPAEPPH
ncbi:MAG: hypothetical protein J6C62_08005 [Clostridia bacterium]|nr:hypothetical protein [Clostridia bacterium]